MAHRAWEFAETELMDTRTPATLRLPVGRKVQDAYRRLDSRTRLIGGIALAVVAVFLAWRFLAGTGGKPTAPPPPVHVATVQRTNVEVVEHTIGTVLAENTVNVTAQVSGQLMSAAFQEGQIVKKGDLLFQIDPRPFQAALEQAQAALAKDSANLASAQNDERRFTALFAQNAASQQQRDQAVATAKALAATVKSDQAAIDLARLNLGYAQIRSPIDGKTGPIMVQPGNLVAAASSNQNASPLVTITQIQPVKLSLFLPQSDLPQIQYQMAHGGLTAVIPMDGAQDGHEVAPIDFVGNAVSAQTGTIELRATFPNADFRLVPGQTVSVGVTLKHLANALVVPRNAVNAGPDGDFVYAVDAQSMAQLVPVKVINDDGANDAIEGKLKPGMHVITEGQLRVLPGRPVTVSKQPATAFAAPVPPGAQ